MFGQYHHALIIHAPQQLRIVSLSSTNVENEERQFNFMKTASSLTSNHHPENVLVNCIIRLQATTEFRSEFQELMTVPQVESKISKLASYFESEDTIIPYQTIKNYPREYQACLERIGDYLLESKVWKEVETGVKFYDVSGDWMKQRHHFRNFTLEEELAYVSKCWTKCLTSPKLIPANTIIDSEGKRTTIGTLQKFSTNNNRPIPLIQKVNSIQDVTPINLTVEDQNESIDALELRYNISFMLFSEAMFIAS
ncbi:uncharacterized protein [Clytia hemisphaerica]|uniref:uncharacterized protein n=1 Tax=Clytia hemisphaerica TaxID=252671 RepID=UPI0034D39477